MLRLMENKASLGFKIETTPYTAETLATANYNQRAYNVKISPDVETYGRKLVRGNFSRDTSIAGRRKATVSFDIDLYPGTTAATAPAWGIVLQACGWKQTAFTTTGISWTPHADYNRVPATIEYVIPEEGTTPNQIVFKVSGAMGKVTFAAEQIGQPLKMSFEFTGVLDSVSTRTFANLIPVTVFDSSLPPALLAATFSFFATIQYPSKFSIDGGETVELFSALNRAQGYEGARVVDRNMSGDADPDMVTTTDLDLFTPMINNTTGALSVTIGGAPQLVLSAPAAQIVKAYDPQPSEGHIRNAIKIEYKRSSGNDEFEVLQGAKA